MNRKELKLKEYTSPSLNIIASLKLSNKKIETKGEYFSNIIASIFYKTDKELTLDILNLSFIKLKYLGISNLTINIIDKNDNKNNNLNINNKINNLNCKLDVNSNYNITHYNILDLLNNNNNFIFNIQHIYIFRNMSWEEVITYFRQINYIVSGGKPSERHILSEEKYLLSIFINSIYNNNKFDLSNIINYNILNNIFKYNKNYFNKYIKPNIDFTSSNNKLNLDNKINNYLNNYNVSIKLENEINNFLKRKLFYNKLKNFIKNNINIIDIENFDLNLLFNILQNINITHEEEDKSLSNSIKSIIDYLNSNVNIEKKNNVIKEINNILNNIFKELNINYFIDL